MFDYNILTNKNINIISKEEISNFKFIENVDINEYKEFTNNHYKSHFLQSYEWGQFCLKIKKQIPHYVGIKNKSGKLIGTALLLEKKTPFGFSYMYCPRGFTIDYNNKDAIKVFTKYLKKYLKDNHVIYCKFDPDIEYQDIDCFGNKVIGGNNNYELYNYMLSLGYKHGGFYKLYDGNQPRYTFRINLNGTMEDVKNKFSSSFIKSLKKSDYYDMEVNNDIIPDKFFELIKYNSNKDGFNPKNEEYYKIFTNEMKNNIKYFNIVINPKDILFKIENELKELEELLRSATKRKEDIQDRINRLTKEKEKFGEIKEDKVVICSLICTYTNNHVWSFFQGNNELACITGGVSKCYYEAIKNALDNGYEFFDLFGTVGEPNTDYKNLSKLHNFKKSFGDRYIEFIGEFDLVNNHLLYKLLPILLNVYRKIKM